MNALADVAEKGAATGAGKGVPGLRRARWATRIQFATLGMVAGSRGSYLLTRDSGAVRHFDGVDLGRAIVDTNGAGDSFVAGFLSGYYRQAAFEDCMRLGAIAGAYACGCLGTHEEFVTQAQLQKILLNN